MSISKSGTGRVAIRSCIRLHRFPSRCGPSAQPGLATRVSKRVLPPLALEGWIQSCRSRPRVNWGRPSRLVAVRRRVVNGCTCELLARSGNQEIPSRVAGRVPCILRIAMLKFIKHEKLLLQRHPELNEKWVQDRIAEDPSILGLGDVVLKDKERIQPRAGRLDLLLQDPDTLRRYEVEIQLGKTDEAHIIRTIEYWDIERKRYPQYEHCAVIVAEEMTARFLNVISLFNGTIPLIAVQMNALRISDGISLVFTTVMDELSRGWWTTTRRCRRLPTGHTGKTRAAGRPSPWQMNCWA